LPTSFENFVLANALMDFLFRNSYILKKYQAAVAKYLSLAAGNKHA